MSQSLSFMKLFVSGIFLLVLLSGCTTWVKPGATPIERDSTLSQCRAYAYQRVAPNLVTAMVDPGGYQPGWRECYNYHGKTRCRWNGGFFVPPRYATFDANRGSRDAMVENCMFVNGWHRE